eukprot:6212168-Pleurochrysis_carterae.AAC.1
MAPLRLPPCHFSHAPCWRKDRPARAPRRDEPQHGVPRTTPRRHDAERPMLYEYRRCVARITSARVPARTSAVRSGVRMFASVRGPTMSTPDLGMQEE